MANRRLAPAAEQPQGFSFSPENAAWAQGQIDKYPEGRQASAVISLLWKAQEQHGGWLPQKAIEEVARMLGMPPIRVLEVATFYTMFALEPVGRFWIQLCGTVPCDVCGAKGLKDALRQRIGPPGHVSPDGNFSWIEVECLGACCNAPMAQINHDYYEDLTPESLNKLLDDLAAGRPVEIGPQNGRRASEPQDSIGTLTDASLFDGSRVGAWRARFEETHVDGAAVAQQDAPAPEAAKKEEAASTERRVETEPKPSRPSAGRATETPAADTPAVRSAEGEQPVKDGTAGAEPDAPAPQAGERAEDSRALAEDLALRAEPPQQPKGSGEEGVAAGDEPGAPSGASEPERIRGVSVTERLAHHRHAAGTRPAGLDSARGGQPDALTRINGIGQITEQRLHELGIFHFDQVAAWSPDDIRWVGSYLAFPGRIEREDWVGQARGLASSKGGEE